MKIQLNGEPTELPGTTISVYELLERFEINRNFVAVEINMDIVEREQFSSAYVKEGDTVEIIRYMGGG